jgi:hypothetical protein
MKIKTENIKTLTLNLENNNIQEDKNSIQQLSNILTKENKNLHIHINLNNEQKPNIIENLLKIEGINVIAEMDNKIILSKKKLQAEGLNEYNEEDIQEIAISSPIIESDTEVKVIQPTEIIYEKLDLFKIIEKKAIRSGHILEVNNSFQILQENINNGGVLNIDNSFVFLTKHNKGKIILNENSGFLFPKSNHLGVIEFENVLINDYVEDLIKYSDEKSIYLYLFVENQQLKYDFI